MRWSKQLGVALLGSVLLLVGYGSAACTTSNASPGTLPADAATVIRVVLSEWVVKPASVSIPAGKINFEVLNQGTTEHELVVLKTDLPLNALKLTSDGTEVDEEASGPKEGDTEEIKVGDTKSEMLSLGSGHYVLICNLPGHYQQGMAASFEVK